MNILCWDRVGVGGGDSFQMVGATEFSSFRLGTFPALSRIKDELEQNQEKESSLRSSQGKYKAGLSNLSVHQDYEEDLLKHAPQGPTLRFSRSR